MENRSKLPLFLFLQDISLDGGCERVVVNMANEFIKYYENVHIVSNFQTNLSLKFVINEQVKINYLHKNISIEKWKNEHLFKYLFKSFDVMTAPPVGMQGVELHEYLGHL